MRKVIFALIALAISLLGTQCWAQLCSVEGPPCIQNAFSPGAGNNERIYDFTSTGDGTLVVHFVKVLKPFNLAVTIDHTPDALAEGVFPANTACVPYSTNGGLCDEYDFRGDKTGPNGVPSKGTDYTGLITLTLTYLNSQAVHTPAFLHAPGDNATAVYSEDILTSYFEPPPPPPCTDCLAPAPPPGDPTMGGKTPGLSAVAAFDEPGGNDSFCFVSPQPAQQFTVGHSIEVAFRLTAPSTNCLTAAPIRDKDARVSLAMTDSLGNFISFPPLRNKEEGNKFHFDHKNGTNERDLSTKGLAPGSYTITLFSDEFPKPQSVNITLVAGTDDDDPD